MKNDALVEHLKTASELEIQENITAGPSDGMAFRYSASVVEMNRRNNLLKSEPWWKKPWGVIILSVISGAILLLLRELFFS